MPIITETWANNLDNAVLGRTTSLIVNGAPGALTPNIAFLATYTSPAGKGAFTEPSFGSGYRRLDADGAFWGAPNGAGGAINATTDQTATQASDSGPVRWMAMVESNTIGAQDAIVIDVVGNGYRSVGVTQMTNLWSSAGNVGGNTPPILPANSFYFGPNGHTFQNGDLVAPSLMPGMTAPGGLVCDLTKFYVVNNSDQANGTLQLAQEPAPYGDGSAVTITSPGQALFSLCQPIANLPQNTAALFNSGDLAFGFT